MVAENLSLEEREQFAFLFFFSGFTLLAGLPTPRSWSCYSTCTCASGEKTGEIRQSPSFLLRFGLVSPLLRLWYLLWHHTTHSSLDTLTIPDFGFLVSRIDVSYRSTPMFLVHLHYDKMKNVVFYASLGNGSNVWNRFRPENVKSLLQGWDLEWGNIGG